MSTSAPARRAAPRKQRRRAARSTYRHGDLRRALLAAGVALARSGGPGAVVLREATRRAGVAPNAAYRHFASRDALLQAVREAALSALAVTMEREVARARRLRRRSDADAARAGLRAVGAAYLRFARSETGLFRTAFAAGGDLPARRDAATVKGGNPGPFQLLCAALDCLVASGALPAERRADAEFLAWSAVHGFAMLVIDGPLRALSVAQIERIGRRVLQMVEKGL